jgi:hypothetical protein
MLNRDIILVCSESKQSTKDYVGSMYNFWTLNLVENKVTTGL